MNARSNLSIIAVTTLLLSLPGRAQEIHSPVVTADPSAARNIQGWGVVTNPAGDCKLGKSEDGKGLVITVPANSKRAHNLCIELNNMTAPRVQQPMKGDFDLQVRVNGVFEPSEEMLRGSRVPYLGAGLNVMADDSNYIRLERAVMRFNAPQPRHYINFEIRVDGDIERFGSAEKFPLDPGKPVWLRLERRGDSMRGAMSHDGKEWSWGEPKTLTADAWGKGDVRAGVHAISSCVNEFAPVFTNFSCEAAKKEDKPAEKGQEEKPAEKSPEAEKPQ